MKEELYSGTDHVYRVEPFQPHLYDEVNYSCPLARRVLNGWVYNRERADRYMWISWMDQKRKELEGIGYEYRRTPIPGTGKFKNPIPPRKSRGFASETHHYTMCEQEYPELRLVRNKRRDIAKAYMSWHYDDYDYFESYNHQRGWKRTKKRRQYN